MFAASLYFLLVHQLILHSRGVAPGDEESVAFCKQMRSNGVIPKLDYPANFAVLMDSMNYEDLLPPRRKAVWQQVDNDGNNPVGISTNWIQNSNNPCRQTVQVCGYSAGPQDNWLITQLINRTVNGTRLSQVSVMIEFEQRDCDTTLNCQRTFNTHVYERSSENLAASRTISNYRQVMRVSPDDTSGARVNETIDINFITNHSSFYFAVQDETSCMVITRLLVFYHVCPSDSSNMTIRPRTVAPQISRQATPFLISVRCVENASPIHSGGQGATVKCNEGGIWSLISGLGCKCDQGYVPSVDQRQCEVCPDQQYFSTYTNACDDCPENSIIGDKDINKTLRLDSCECLDGSFLPLSVDTNATCETASTTVDRPDKKAKKPSTNLTVVLPTTLILVGVAMVLFTSLYVYKQRNRRGRVYRVNDGAPWQNGQQPEQNGEINIGQVRNHRERPNQLRQFSSASTRSSAPSIRWNMAYFLFKIFGTPQPPTTPQQPEPNTTPANLNGASGRAFSESLSEKDAEVIPMNVINSSANEDRHDYVNAHIKADTVVIEDDSFEFKSVEFNEWDYLNTQSQDS